MSKSEILMVIAFIIYSILTFVFVFPSIYPDNDPTFIKNLEIH